MRRSVSSTLPPCVRSGREKTVGVVRAPRDIAVRFVQSRHDSDRRRPRRVGASQTVSVADTNVAVSGELIAVGGISVGVSGIRDDAGRTLARVVHTIVGALGDGASVGEEEIPSAEQQGW